ncbi:MAG: PfkB family carbohydrate kinase [Gammaproteobacteria bacterium]|nr:PfkB family carbohydrate kinase [Gammaproteobacteria bacterium]MDH3414860.1 PfkB family carbohydrate kinase [Gammaproteobacteria bacterium]
MSDIHILIIGGASLDTLDGADQLVAGGAGMYTAMASRRSGASVTLFAPRPEPVPAALQQVAASVSWLGPTVAQQDLPHFEITHRDGETRYVQARFGAEASISPASLPADLSGFDCVHLVPLGNIRNQYDFMLACRANGARRISAGTALDLIDEQPDDASALLDGADFFFMNEKEAVRLFGSMAAVRSRTGQTIFVTQGSDGATVVQGDIATQLPGVAATVRDPTGAGDTFCGATLVGLSRGHHPVMAARNAMPLAAQMIGDVGPAALLLSSPPPGSPTDERVVVSPAQISRIAALISELEDVTPYAFTGPDLPRPGHPASLDYFFASTLQQFSFWSTNGGRYERPLVATVDGEERKGAFYLFRAYLRWLESSPEMLTPAGQAELSNADMKAVFRADDGTHPMPALELHLQLARQYGRDMLALGLTPQEVLEQVNTSATPLRTLFQILDHVGGYKEDPLRKKAALLAIILQQRPEAFLASREDKVPPVVDYHVMRSCLRTGLVDVVDNELASKLVGRQLLSQAEEWAVRNAAHHAVERVVSESGKSMGAVDWFFFQARKRCPEMTEPRCSFCAVEPVCAKRKELFQPVRRTSFY